MKKRFHIVIRFFAISLLLAGCGKQQVDLPEPKKDEQGKTYFENKDELVTWVSKSEATSRNKKLGDFQYNLRRLSPDMMALQELQGNTSDAAAYEEARSHYTGLIYYRLNIRNDQFPKELLKYDLSNEEEYNQRVNYCAFQLNRDVYITNGRDTVPCALHQFERTFNIDAGLNFLLAFPVIDLGPGHTLVFEDQMFKNGIIKFTFDQNGNAIPYFKIK